MIGSCILSAKDKKLKVIYCPTEKMIADYHSKPLQGKPFVDLRDGIMGVREDEFSLYKSRYQAVLEKYGLFDKEESDLSSL